MSGYEWRSGFDRESRAPVDEKWSRWEHRLELDGLSSRHESETNNMDMDDLRIRIQQLSKRLHEIQDEPREVKDDTRDYHKMQGREEDLRYTRLGHQIDDGDHWERRHDKSDPERYDERQRHPHEMRRGAAPNEFIDNKSRDLRDWLDPRHSHDERKYRATHDYKNTERDRNPKESYQKSDRHYQDLRSGPDDYTKTHHQWREDKSDLREDLKRGRYQADGYESSRQPTSALEGAHPGKPSGGRYQPEEFKSSSLVSHMRQDNRREPPSRDNYQYDDYNSSNLAKTIRKDDRPELSESGGRQISDYRSSSEGGSVREANRIESSFRSINTSSAPRSLYEGHTKNVEVPIHQEPVRQTAPNLCEDHQGLIRNQYQDLTVSDKKSSIKNPFQADTISDPLMTTLLQNRIENLNRLKTLIDEESSLMKHNPSPEASRSLMTMEPGEGFLLKDQPADIESFLDSSRDNDAIGLEYIVEIHHNTVKSVDHSYHCLLCNVPIKSGKVDRIIYPVVLAHVKTVGHKINYMGKHFPKKKQTFQSLNGLIAKDDLTCFVEKVIEKFGRKKVKIVEGMKLFKQDITRIKKDAEASEHHTEEICKIQVQTHKSNIDDLQPLPILDLQQDSSNLVVLSQEQQMLNSRPPGEVFNDWYEAQRVLGLTSTPEDPLGGNTYNFHLEADTANSESYNNRSSTIDLKYVSGPTQARNREIEYLIDERQRHEVTDEHQIRHRSRSIDKIDSSQRPSTNRNKSKEKSGTPTKTSRVKDRLGSANRDRKDEETRMRRSRSRKRSRSLRRSYSPVHRPTTSRRSNSPSRKPSSFRPDRSRSPRRHRSRSPKMSSLRRKLSRSPRPSYKTRRRSRSPRSTAASGARSRSPRLTSKITGRSRSPRPSSLSRGRSRSPRPSSLSRGRSRSPRPSSLSRGRSRSPRPSSLSRGRSRSPRPTSTNRGRSRSPRIRDKLRRSRSRDDWLFSLMSSTNSAIQSVCSDYPVSFPPPNQSMKLSQEYAKDNVSLSRDIPGGGFDNQDIYELRKSAEKFSSSKPESAFNFLEKLLAKKNPERKNQPELTHLPPVKIPEVLKIDERLQKEIDKKVNEFLIQENELLNTLKPRRGELVEPDENDPEYRSEWLKFYKMKRAYQPEQDNLVVVEKKWKSEWKCIQAFRLGKTFSESRDYLLSKHQLSQVEIDQSQKRREHENPFDKPPNFWDKYLSNNYVLKLKSSREAFKIDQPLVSQKEKGQDQVLSRDNATQPKDSAGPNQPIPESIPTISSKSQSQVAVEQDGRRNLEDGVMKFEDVELDYGRIFRWGTQGTWNNLKSVLDELLNADISITVMEIESSPHKMLLKKIISRLDQCHEPNHPITPLTSQQIKDSIHSLYCEEEELSSAYSCMSALHQRWNGFNFDSVLK